MYSDKLVTCLKSNGKVLREFNDTIYIPYGEEYSVYLKNLNSVRAVVKITIDGTDVCEDGFVVNPNSELDVERFIKNNNLKKGNKFKFIERTAGIEKHRGIKIEDGLIWVSFQFEKVLPKPTYLTYSCPAARWEWKPGCYPSGTQPYWNLNVVGSDKSNVSFGTTQVNMNSPNNTENYANSILRGTLQNAVVGNSVFLNNVNVKNDVGITVPGSESNQQFQMVSGFPVEDEEHVMVIRILGETKNGQSVKVPITVKTKTKCVTCSRNNKVTAKFCSECGTSLSIL